MSRKSLERRRRAQERWPHLASLFPCYFNEDHVSIDGSLAGAFAAAAKEGSLEYRRAVLDEWRGWNATEGAVDDIRPFLYDGFLVNLQFDTPLDARNFVNRLYDEVLVRVKHESAKLS